ncbi:hypothetical protein N7507_009642 [Penicillium longicatenatum]|nr:hypothetical protein N7507_009642 [Penicillium longicatenatum]
MQKIATILCRSCQKDVFGERTLEFLARLCHNDDLSKDIRPNEGVSLDQYAYFFTGGDTNRAPVRSFHQKLRLVQKSAKQGCIFCSQLEAAILCKLLDESQSKDRTKLAHPDLEFTFDVHVHRPWKYCLVEIHWKTAGGQGSDTSDASFHFRLYYKDEVNSPVPSPKSSWLADEGPSWDQDIKGLRAGLGFCLRYHSRCNQSTQITLPTRLLKLSGSGSSPEACLVIAAEITSTPVQYACLSYCWGGPQPERTTAQVVSTYSESIDPGYVPQTVYDAMKVALSIGVEYLWVDSFCIVQDDPQEMAHELNKLSSIYRGGLFTICAMSARAATEGFLGVYEKSQEGGEETNGVTTWNVNIAQRHSFLKTLRAVLFPGRRRIERLGRNAVLELRSDSTEIIPSELPLMKRAWCQQEALLSPRIIMFFSDDQLPVLRCNEYPIRSDGSLLTTYPKSLIYIDEEVLNVEGEDITLNNYKHIVHWSPGKQWTVLVEEFTRRSLTIPEDKTLALIGIASEFERLTSLGEYWAGLWSTTINYDLLWMAPSYLSPRGPEKTYVGPSWSWLSRNHAITYREKHHMNMLDDEDAQITCQIIPVNPISPKGMIGSAILTVKCRARQIDDASESPGGIEFDDDPMPPLPSKLWLLKIAEHEPYNYGFAKGLVVVEVPDCIEIVYKRVEACRGVS